MPLAQEIRPRKAGLRNLKLLIAALMAAAAALVLVAPSPAPGAEDNIFPALSDLGVAKSMIWLARADLAQADDDDDDGDDDDGGAGGGGADDGGADDGGGPGGGGADDGGGDDGGGPGGGADDGGGDDGGGDDDGGGPGGGGDDDDGGGDDGAGLSGGADDDGDDGAGAGPGGGDDDGGSAPATGGQDDDGPGHPGPDTDQGARLEPEIQDERGNRARRNQIIALSPSAEAITLSRQLGFRVSRRVGLSSLGFQAVILSVPKRMSAREALRLIRMRDPRTRYDYDHLYDFKPSMETSIPVMPGIEIAERRPLSMRRDVTIGVIDTGINTQHPSLNGARVETKDFLPRGVRAPIAHGTAVASILIDQSDGLLPKGQVYAASVFTPSSRGGDVGSVVEIAEAINWLVDREVTVINMSLAGPHNELLQAACANALQRGYVIVAAVGNAGPGARPQFPASYEGVVGVTATDVRNIVFRRAARGPQVDFAAPGVNVRGANGSDEGFSLNTGTSFAAPYAAAVIALQMKKPDPERAQSLFAFLAQRARDLGPRGRDNIYGFGLITP